MKYISLFFAILYMLFGILLLATSLVPGLDFKVDNGFLFGGLLLVYGAFRLYRYIIQYHKTQKTS